MKRIILDKESGFTLLEVIVAIMIFAVVFLGANSLYKRGVDSWSNIEENTCYHQSARYCFMRIIEEIRNYNADEIFVVEGGKGILLGEEGNMDCHIQLLEDDGSWTVYFDRRWSPRSPIASNIKDLKFTKKKIVVLGDKDYKLVEENKDWDLLKVEVVSGGADKEYKLETLILPGSNNTF